MTAKRKMPVKTVTLEFSEDGYPGFACVTRLNTPMGVFREINGQTEEAAREGYLKLFPSWDFVDDEGEAIPHTADGFDAIPQDLFAAMLARRVEALKAAAMPAPLDSASSKTPSDGEKDS